MNRRDFLKYSGLLSFAAWVPNSWASNVSPAFDLTFLVGADTHFDEPPETDQYRQVQAMNKVPQLKWPAQIDGIKTNFASAGQFIEGIRGLVLAGDLVDRAHPAALNLFKQRYEQGPGDRHIHFPTYVGLGNHDVNPEVEAGLLAQRRQMMWDYVDARHKGAAAPVPVTNYDALSRNYSWDWEHVHLVHGQLYPGDTAFGQTSSLDWLADDLARHAAHGKPVVIFQHYGYDEWAIKWFDAAQLKKYRKVIAPYNVVGIFAGHTHEAINMKWQGYDVFEVNNAWCQPNEDGDGSFAIVRITDRFLHMMTCKWMANGEISLSGPFLNKTF
ncbi:MULTISPECIES: metallophosphoesterase [unclassified Carboxylicivirga]|uniref:metallophosphoesterase n=1 Tax=Carboxylicivirga TaxID=1628153 RepID=UPI003D32F5C6